QGRLVPVFSESQAQGVLLARQGLSLLGRGQGRAYGDAALNSGNLTLNFTPANRFLSFDAKRGLLHAEAGVTLEQILNTFIPRGWFLPVTPGTKFPTLGGSVACDVHGKSHLSISHYVERLHMLMADGSRVACSPTEKPDLFWATTGGMGLTGLITSVELRLQAIESSFIKYEGVKAANLEEIFRLFEESAESPLTVAWIDCLAQGRTLGRSIMMRGEFARKRDLKTSARRQHALAVSHKPQVTVPFDLPGVTLNRFSMAAFNAAYFGKHPRHTETIMDFDSFFYPLDSVLHWNRIYGKSGMVQYQFLIPPRHSFEGIKTLLEAISASGKASFLAVLKKFGPMNNQGLLSFPTPGHFLALDFPVGNGDIFKHMDRWDELVLKFGGRVYLAKDARMHSGTFRAMYPRLPEWLRVKKKYDPHNVFASDLGRRLGLPDGGGLRHRRSGRSQSTRGKA
ncbi:MAG: FAD-binding oxidoreductase, partial [Candidatus Firestonebacteria bacterium]|nr:FAD-binding oxidoreductase [Candidatus Firestonebacteria bacterium]